MTEFLGVQANPYNYGFPIEVTPESVGTDLARHYAMGRFSHENSLVMGDEKTVYQSDDGTDRILWKFIASEAGDLSAGTLYAAKLTQDGESFGIEWIELGTGSDAEIAETVAAMDLGQ
jgi:secreted PhoX family phosphatase